MDLYQMMSSAPDRDTQKQKKHIELYTGCMKPSKTIDNILQQSQTYLKPRDKVELGRVSL
jgi:hypothetical protein